MKKYLTFVRTSVLVSLFSVLLSGCFKDECDVVEKELWGVRAENNMLTFESLESYEYLVAKVSTETREQLLNQIDLLDFKNYFSVPVRITENLNEEIQEMDEVLGRLLNSDGAIQIENHIYKVDLRKELVFVIDAINRERDYSDLVAGNTDNPNVTFYPIDADVLYLVNGEKEYRCGGIGSIPDADGIKTATLNGIQFGIRARHFRAGIFFRTSALAQYPQNLSGIHYLSIEANTPRIWLRKRPCGSNDIITIPAGKLVEGGQFHTQGFEAYSGTRNLNGMYFFVRAKLTLAHSSGAPSTTSAVTDWAGRNVNSPH